MKVTTLRKVLIVAYVVSLLVFSLYVQKVLKEGDIQVEKKEIVKEAIEIKPVNVTLQVVGAKSQATYKPDMKNVDSVIDLLDKARIRDTFFYEKTVLTDRQVFDLINHEKAPNGYEWRIFEGTKDITQTIEDVTLADDTTYYIRLIKL